MPELYNSNVDVDTVDVMGRDAKVASAQTSPSEGGASDRGLCHALVGTSVPSVSSDSLATVQELPGGIYVYPGLKLF